MSKVIKRKELKTEQHNDSSQPKQAAETYRYAQSHALLATTNVTSPAPAVIFSSQTLLLENAKLRTLAAQFQVDLRHKLRKIEVNNRPVTYRDEASTKAALDILQQRRSSDPAYKAPTGFSKLTKSKAKMAEFDIKEIQRAFEAAADSNASLGVIDALLNMGASVDVARRATKNLLKMMQNFDREDIRSQVVQEAVRRKNHAMLQLFVAHADQRTLDESLLIASELEDLQAIELLVSHNADYSSASDAFITAVRKGNLETVTLLLSASKGPSAGTKALALIEAVEIGDVPKTIALLASNADGSFDESHALRSAISHDNIPLVLCICGAPLPPSSNQLDSMLALCYDHDTARDENLYLLEICLASGVSGPHAPQVLQKAVTLNNLAVVKLMLYYKVPADTDGGEAPCQAVSLGHVDIFEELMGVPLDATALNNALVCASETPSTAYLKFVTELLAKHASPDHEQGKSLLGAVQKVRLDVLQLLVPVCQDKNSLRAAFDAIVRDTKYQTRIRALTIILRGNPVQSDLDRGLGTLVEERPMDDDAVNLLLTAGASPEAFDHKAIKFAACHHNTTALDLLLPWIKQPKTAFSVAIRAMTRFPSWYENSGLETLSWLLESGADATEIEDSLIEAITLFNAPAVKLLADFIVDKDTYTQAFTEMLRCSIVGKSEPRQTWLQKEYLELTELLLKKGAQGEIVDSALLLAIEDQISTKSGQKHEGLIRCLLENGASVDYGDGAALKMAIEAGDISLLKQLCEAGPLAVTLTALTPLTLLHEHHAAKIVEMLNILTAGENKPNLAKRSSLHGWLIFLAMEHYPKEPTIVQRLVELGCPINVQIEYKVFGDTPPEEGIEAHKRKADFYKYKAKYASTVDEMERYCDMSALWFEQAAKLASTCLAADSPMLLSLAYEHALLYLDFSPKPQEGISIAQQAIDAARAVNGVQSEEKLKLLDLLRSSNGETRMVLYGSGIHIKGEEHVEGEHARDPPSQPFGEEKALEIYQKEPDMNWVEYSALASTSEDGDASEILHEQDKMPVENVTPLLWACCQVGEQSISPSIVKVLLENGGDVNTITEKSGSSGLTLAARHHNPDLVALLVGFKPDSSVKDKLGNSPLLYAARNNDKESTIAILATNPCKDDGSVHEAAVRLNFEVLRVLLQAGHDSNFRSNAFGNLTPLGQVAKFCDGSHITELEKTLDVLMDAHADPLTRCRGKTILYLALENKLPVPVTSAIIDRIMYKHMDDKANVYNLDGFNYSPSKYIEKGLVKLSSADEKVLLELIRSRENEAVYYADKGLGMQPEDACGIPKSLLAQEIERRELLNMRRKANHEEESLRDKHEQKLQHNEERSDEAVGDEWEEHDLSKRLEDDSQEQKIRHLEETREKTVRQQTEKIAFVKIKNEMETRRKRDVMELDNQERMKKRLQLQQVNNEKDRQKRQANALNRVKLRDNQIAAVKKRIVSREMGQDKTRQK